jgi:phospholipid/cholesterol/gamma-HCH transport system permease protein
MNLPPQWRATFDETGDMFRFGLRFFQQGYKPKYEIREFIRQCFIVIGLVITMQLRPTLLYYGVESKLPDMIGIAIIREIGPILTALIFAGKIGSSIGAELGSMKVTEQIDAMEVSGTNPFKYLVVTRILATTMMLPVLIIISDFIALYGAYLGVNIKGHTSFTLFYKKTFDAMSLSDLVPAFIKSYFFGFAVGMVGCYKGYNSRKGTEGVGRSANSAVVVSSILIFIIDLIAVQITELLGIN